MTNIIKQIKKATKDIRLSKTEKASIKNVLINNMEANPVRFDNVERHQLHKAYGIPSPFLNNNFRNKKTMPILAILGLLMSGSAASFAAENTVPGNILYPVKIHVNENVMSAVAVSPKAQAELDVKLVDRRLKEVEKLATIGNVSEQAQKNAVDNLKKFTERANEDVSKFENENDDELAALTAERLAEILKAHANLIASLNALAVATSTQATQATSTATSTNSTASTTPVINKEMLKDLLKTVRESHKDVEDHHSELKNKIESHHDEEDDEDHYVATSTPNTTATSTTATSTAVATTTPTPTSTPTTTPYSSKEKERGSFEKIKDLFSNKEKHKEENKDQSKSEHDLENKTEKVEDDNR